MKLFSGQKTLLFLVDEHKAYMEEVALEFHDTTKYEIVHCYSVDRMKDIYEKGKYFRYHTLVAVISASFNGDRSARIAELKQNIKDIQWMNRNIELIVLLPEYSEKLQNDLMSLGCYAVFQRNENAFLRISNHLRGIISKRVLMREKKYTRITYLVLLVYVLLLLITGVIFMFMEGRSV
ncbi:MAG TPA: hypothetical protein ENF21_02910 [Bacteroidetes bacterium]|nr:hypothetical protein [Bacteroidota bacterium]